MHPHFCPAALWSVEVCLHLLSIALKANTPSLQVGAHTPNFHKMVGNPVCRQIDWQENDAHLAAWREGRTGFPWIDAIMTQLREWGWVHHLARHSVACFLTRGDLYISWERGVEVFEELLIDQVITSPGTGFCYHHGWMGL